MGKEHGGASIFENGSGFPCGPRLRDEEVTIYPIECGLKLCGPPKSKKKKKTKPLGPILESHQDGRSPDPLEIIEISQVLEK